LRRATLIEGGAVAFVLAAFVVAWVWRSGEAAPRAGIAAGAAPLGEVASSRPFGGAPTAAEVSSDAVSLDASRSPRTTAPGATVEVALDEAALMARLRGVKDVDAGAAVVLAREGNRRFPDGADAAERSSILIHALAAQGLASEARGEAEDMINRYPDSSWVREVELFTGAHRHRNIRLTEAGALEYY
jgi:hypothetical protein